MKLLRPTRHRLHWVLDVTFREDLSRLRKGVTAPRTWPVCATSPSISCAPLIDKRSLKTRRKRASFDPTYLQAILGASAR